MNTFFQDLNTISNDTSEEVVLLDRRRFLFNRRWNMWGHLLTCNRTRREQYRLMSERLLVLNQQESPSVCISLFLKNVSGFIYLKPMQCFVSWDKPPEPEGVTWNCEDWPRSRHSHCETITSLIHEETKTLTQLILSVRLILKGGCSLSGDVALFFFIIFTSCFVAWSQVAPP